MTTTSLPALAVESQAWLILTGFCGILLLVLGGWVIRLGVAITGLALGSLLGWMLWAGFELPVPGWLMLTVGALAALCLALLLARFVTALLLGLALAAWLVGLVLAWAVFDPSLESKPMPVPTMIASLVAVEPHATGNGSGDHDPMASLHAAFQEDWSGLQDTWLALPSNYQLSLGLAAVAGLALGVLIGIAMHRLALTMMAATWGGLLLLVSAIGLAGGGTGEGPWQSSIAMMTAWTAVSALGWAVQRGLFHREPRDAG